MFCNIVTVNSLELFLFNIAKNISQSSKDQSNKISENSSQRKSSFCFVEAFEIPLLRNYYLMLVIVKTSAQRIYVEYNNRQA